MRWPIIFLVFVLVVPFSLADVHIDPFSSTKYNIGDTLLVSGSASVSQSTRGFVTLAFNCGATDKVVTTIFTELSKDKANVFSKTLSVPKGLSGDCVVKAYLKDSSGNSLGEGVSDKFAITSDLRGTFENSKSSFQLGEKFFINGLISRFDNSPVDGSATIYFKKDSEVFFLDVADVKAGELKYEKDLSLIPKGDYKVDVEVVDFYGNTHLFESLYSISVSGDLTVKFELDRTSYKAGDVLGISGSVSGSIAESLGSLEIILNTGDIDVATTTALAGGSFNFNYNIPSDIKSGEHSFKIIAKDDKGNYGEQEGKFSVDAVATALTLNVEKDGFIPGDKVDYIIEMKDQAGDLYDGSVLVKLYNNNGVFVESQQINANSGGSFALPNDAAPGNWKVVAEGFTLSASDDVVVKEYVNLALEPNGKMLKVTNTGNVPYNDYLVLKAGEQEAKKFLNLGLGESTEISLSRLFGAGNHSIYSPLTDKTFEVQVEEQGIIAGVGDTLNDATGNVVARATLPGRSALLAVLFIIMLLALVFIFKPSKSSPLDAKFDRGKGVGGRIAGVFSRDRKYSDEQRTKDYEDGRKKLAELNKKGIRKEGVNYKATDDDMKDFKERITKQVKEEEARQQQAKSRSSLGTLFN